jgi:hypothetical protein
MLTSFVAEFITVPVDLLCIDAKAWTVFGMFKIVALGEFGSAISTPFLAVNARTRYKDCVEMLKCDYFVCDIVISGSNDIFQFSFESCVEEKEMFFGCDFLFSVDGFSEL